MHGAALGPNDEHNDARGAENRCLPCHRTGGCDVRNLPLVRPQKPERDHRFSCPWDEQAQGERNRCRWRAINHYPPSKIMSYTSQPVPVKTLKTQLRNLWAFAEKEKCSRPGFFAETIQIEKGIAIIFWKDSRAIARTHILVSSKAPWIKNA